MSTGPHTGAKRLGELLSDPSKIIVCPGVHDGLAARIAIWQDFNALYMVNPITKPTPHFKHLHPN
jgi:2-methylisocitrate lyase-like PEP mutase family enzyme